MVTPLNETHGALFVQLLVVYVELEGRVDSLVANYIPARLLKQENAFEKERRFLFLFSFVEM
jgi:hypothetical protein